MRTTGFWLAGAVVMGAGLLVAEDKKPAPPQGAALGLTSRAASAGEKQDFGLGDALAGRVNGVVASEVEKDGAAEKAGVVAGDIVLAVDNNRLYSDDDLQDFVRAAKPGQKVNLLLKRAETKKDETVEATLGSAPLPAGPRLEWTYAGPAQLAAALAEAKKSGKKVMVGISGAET